MYTGLGDLALEDAVDGDTTWNTHSLGHSRCTVNLTVRLEGAGEGFLRKRWVI